MDKLIEAVKVSIPYIITYLVLILVFAFFVYLYNLKLALILAFIQFTWPFGVAIVLIAEYRYFYVRKNYNTMITGNQMFSCMINFI